MKKKILVLSIIVFVVVLAITIFFVIHNKQNNPLGLSSDFVFEETFQDNDKTVMCYRYKKYIKVFIAFNKDHSINTLDVSSNDVINPNFTVDYNEITNLVKYLLSKDFFYFTDDEKSQIISHIYKNDSFHIDNMFILISIQDNGFAVSISPSVY